MAGPRIFVPGPSVNPNIGTPAQFISLIDDTIKSNRRARVADERTQQDKIFRQQTADLNARKQDFLEAAPERAELLRVDALARDNEKSQLVANMSEGLQYAGGDRFTTLEEDLMKDPRYAQLDEAGRLSARNNYINSNPSALTDPTKFGNELRQSLAATGKFTGAEVDAAVAGEISRRYPTADPDIIKSMLAKPKDFIGSGGSTVNIDGKLFSTTKPLSGSNSLITGAGGPDDRQTVLDRQSELRGLSNNPSTLPDILGGGRLEIPGGNLDVSKQDLSNMIGILATEGINSPTAVEAALGKAFTDNNDLKGAYDYRTDAGKNKLIAEARKAQETEERRKGGGTSQVGGAAGIFTPADAVAAAKTYNSGLLSTLTPQALSNAEVASTFLNSLGAAQAAPNTTRQGSDGGGAPVVTPEVVPTPVPVPAVADAVNPEAEFQIGGPVQEQVAVDRIFNLIQEGAQGLQDSTPAGILKNAVTEGVPAAQKLFESLTPPGPGVLDSGPAPSPQAQRQTAVDNLTSSQRSEALKKARALSKKGQLGLADGEGRNRDDSLLIAYFQYLEGQRN